jgi:HD-GYP domain-containing protein (c-di-GMP phosphodiesterase class II)
MMRVTGYVYAVAALAISSAGAVYLLHPEYSSAQLEAVAWFVFLALVSLLQAYRLPAGGAGSTAFFPLIAAALISPNWLTVAAAGAAHAAAEFWARRQIHKAVFNVAQMSLSIAGGLLVYWALGGTTLLALSKDSLLTMRWDVILPLAGLVFTFLVLNTILVSGAVAISQNGSFLQVWKRNTVSTLAYDVLAAPVIFLLGIAYVRFGPLGAFVVAVPIYGARQLYKTNRQLEMVNQELLELMVKAIEARDPYTSGHSRRVAHFSRIIARALGLSSKQIERVATAALLHDVGKIHEVFAPILRKPGKLTADEWAIMQTHPVKSAELVATVSHLRDLVSAVRHHHENWDGSGYPDGLVGYQIPLESRIIMFADTIDAMTSDRPYRAALGEGEVRSELVTQKGRQFDPEICETLLASTLFPLLFAPKEPQISANVAPAGRRLVVSGAGS